MDLSYYGVALGRALIAACFVYMSYAYARSWQERVQSMRARKVLLPTLVLWVVIFLYFLGGLGLLVGYEINIIASVFIAILLLANALYYRFWVFKGGEMRQVLLGFMRNLALIGALVLVIFR